ncbi:MAG: DNA-directed RNA polymerase subunit L [Methanosarcinales archaeon]|jgi:DNA-directed RNA polymerase subunit L|nr:DNA-directed RNA polymerase subunit L [Methanosarcinales archaeon]
MELTILSQSKDEMEILVKGETHTLMNIIKAALLDDPRIETAFYDVKRLSNSVEREPVLYIKTMPGEKPIEILKDVAVKITAMCDEFSAAFSQAVRQT